MFFLFLTFVFCSKYDLYSKSKVRIDVEKVKPYYLSLIEKVNREKSYYLYIDFYAVEAIHMIK